MKMVQFDFIPCQHNEYQQCKLEAVARCEFCHTWNCIKHTRDSKMCNYCYYIMGKGLDSNIHGLGTPIEK